jgi:hypothetical protein
VDEQTLRQGFGAANRLVEMTNWVAQYERPLAPSNVDALPGTPEGDQRVALFVVLSTPKVEVAGQQFNSVGGFSARDVFGQVQSVYGGLREAERVDERTLTVLRSATRVVGYRAAGDSARGGVLTDI